MKKYFGTDGIRGIPGESLKEEIVTKIFSSVEKILAPKSVAIILDTRESCEMITEWIVKGFSEEVSITNYGILPSGSMPILLETFNEDLGIIISASHNPSEYNGIKLIDKNGSKLDDDLEQSKFLPQLLSQSDALGKEILELTTERKLSKKRGAKPEELRNKEATQFNLTLKIQELKKVARKGAYERKKANKTKHLTKYEEAK